MSQAFFTHQATVARSESEVWDRLQDVQTWGAIGPVEEVWDPQHAPDGRLLGYRWSTTVAFRTYRGTARVNESDPPRRMVLSLDGGEVDGILEAELSSGGPDRTTISVTLEIHPRGFLSTLFFSAVTDAVATGLPAQLDRFAASLDGS